MTFLILKAKASEAIFASTLISEIVLQFFKYLLSLPFFSIKSNHCSTLRVRELSLIKGKIESIYKISYDFIKETDIKFFG